MIIAAVIILFAILVAYSSIHISGRISHLDNQDLNEQAEYLKKWEEERANKSCLR